MRKIDIRDEGLLWIAFLIGLPLLAGLSTYALQAFTGEIVVQPAAPPADRAGPSP